MRCKKGFHGRERMKENHDRVVIKGDSEEGSAEGKAIRRFIYRAGVGKKRENERQPPLPEFSSNLTFLQISSVAARR